MRQVPNPARYVIVGNGRVAYHFSYYLSLLSIPYQSWSRSSSIPLNHVVRAGDIVLLLISDSAINRFVKENPCLTKTCCVHFSGNLTSHIAFGAHPLMSFGSRLYSMREYQSIPWILEPTTPPFSELFPALPNDTFVIDSSKKSLYHAWCVMSNNFTTLLWQQFFDRMVKEFKIPKSHLIPILERTMKNLVQDHQCALTGPLVRGDRATIWQHLEALSDDAFKDIYHAFASFYQKQNPMEVMI